MPRIEHDGNICNLFCQITTSLEYGEEVWKEVLRLSDCPYTVFNTHQIYPDCVIPSLALACAEITSDSYDSFMNFFGRCFIRYMGRFGYDVSIQATGRFFTDFLQNVDNLHSQFRFTYPKMESPSMYLTEVNENGCNLVYSSVRQGFKHYLMGQLQQVAMEYFHLDVTTTVLETRLSNANNRSLYVITLRLDFDNSQYIILLRCTILLKYVIGFGPQNDATGACLQT
ncbi:soluble guanylate cyclase 89Db-like [Photinus pyralis]|uniref:soluble guanylate cyclase 89Db-like n=1 Tax=Photinus pyralis TaxID=7054 RepID=UPI001267544C|nr:soluble guanylate cyclase 89Db-like [Photinus pyralis]